MLKKRPQKFQKQRTWLISSRICTKKIHCPRILKTFRIWPFLEKKIDRSLEKKTFQNFRKHLISKDFFQIRLQLYCWSCVLKTFNTLRFLRKRDVFFSKKHLKVFINTKHGFFLSECFPKVIIAHAISKISKLEFFWKKMTFFAKISLKDFRSTIWHFLSRLRVRLSYCFGILKTIKILVCLEKQMLSLKRSLFFSRIDKRGIFIPACVSKDIISQENWKRSTAWDFRESRLVIWKNCLNFLKNADICKIYIECVSDGFLTKNSQKLQTLDFLGETGRVVWKLKPEFF